MGALKYLGILVLLIGVGVLAATTTADTPSNTMLLAGLALVICGYLAHIFFNRNSKRIE